MNDSATPVFTCGHNQLWVDILVEYPFRIFYASPVHPALVFQAFAAFGAKSQMWGFTSHFLLRHWMLICRFAAPGQVSGWLSQNGQLSRWHSEHTKSSPLQLVMTMCRLLHMVQQAKPSSSCGSLSRTTQPKGLLIPFWWSLVLMKSSTRTCHPRW